MAYEKEREAVKAVYKSANWIRKVNAMSDNQVIAIYFRLKKQNKIKT